MAASSTWQLRRYGRDSFYEILVHIVDGWIVKANLYFRGTMYAAPGVNSWPEEPGQVVLTAVESGPRGQTVDLASPAVAQLVERGIENPEVPDSISGGRAIQTSIDDFDWDAYYRARQGDLE